MDEQSYRYAVGDIECVALYDGYNDNYKAQGFFPTAPAEQLAEALRKYDVDPARIRSPYTCLAVRTAGEWVLVDTGAGPLVPTTGLLRSSVVAAGIAPESIKTIVITHAHPDHIGGVTDSAGQANYPNASWWMWRAEWEFWTGPSSASQPAGWLAANSRAFPKMEPRLTTVDCETEVAPGVFILPAVGHTPGHCVVAVRSGGDELIYLSDTVLHPIHLEHPEWQPIFDMDKPAAAAAMRAVCERANERHCLVQSSHFDPFPSLGYIERARGGWKWQSLALASA